MSESIDSIVADHLPHLGAGDVIDEVVALLAKLECERFEVLEALQRERRRSQVLKLKINEFCKRRLVDLPKAVQAGEQDICVHLHVSPHVIANIAFNVVWRLLAEHESCASDLSELNWHVDFNTKKFDIILKLANKAEEKNTKLKEDIDFINGHVYVPSVVLVLLKCHSFLV